MRLPQNNTNQVLIPFTRIDGFEKISMFMPSQTSHEYFGQHFIIRLDKGQSLNLYDIDGEMHQIQRFKEGSQSIFIYNNFLIYDAGKCHITNPK